MTSGIAMLYAIRHYEVRYERLPEVIKVEMLAGAAIGDDWIKATIGITNANDIRFDFELMQEESGRVLIHLKNDPFSKVGDTRRILR